MKPTTKIIVADPKLLDMFPVKDGRKYAIVVLAGKSSIRFKLNDVVEFTLKATVTKEELDALKIDATVYFDDQGQAVEITGGKKTQEKQSAPRSGSDAKLSNKF